MLATHASLSIGDLAAIVAAAAGIALVVVPLVGFLSRWVGYRRLLVEAAYEAAHNLQHLASVEVGADGAFRAWPDFTVDRARQLLDLQLFRWTARNPAIYGDLDHMIRNADYLARFPFDAAGIKAATPVLQYYGEHAIRLLVHSADFRGVRQVLRLLEIEWIATPADPHVRWSWQQAEEDREAHEYGTHAATQLIAWEGSTNDHRPSLCDQARKWQDPPPRGKRPRLPWR